MNICKNLKGAVGVCLAVMLLVFSCCFTVSAQGDDPAPQNIDDRDVTWFYLYASGLTPWITAYCDDTAQAYADYQDALQKAKEIVEKTAASTQQQVDELAVELRRAYLALDIVATDDQYDQFRFALKESFSRMKLELTGGLPPDHSITRASHGYLYIAETKFESIEHSTNIIDWIDAAKALKEALAKVEVNRVDYSPINELSNHIIKDIDPNADKYTKSSYEKFLLACHYYFLQYENIPTQEECDSIVAGLEQAEKDLILKGDCDRDGSVSIRDVTSVQKDLAGIDKLCDEACDAADVNEDGVVNTQDILLSQKYIAKSIDMFPVSNAS